MIVYFNGNFISKDKVVISPDDRGFLFGDGVYEVIKANNSKLFCGNEHIERLKWNLAELRITGASELDFNKLSEELIRLNGFENTECKIYIQITRGVAPRIHCFPNPPIKPTVYIEVTKLILPVEKWERGVKIILRQDQRRERCDIKSISLLPSILANQEAVENNAEEVVFIKNGFVTEGSHTTFCVVFDNSVYTYPEGNSILPGITRGVIKELCKKTEVPFIEKFIPVEDLVKADELFLLGTTTEVMPVIQVEDSIIKNGIPGNITRLLQNELRNKIRNL